MNTIKDRLITLFFHLSILFFIIGFKVSDTPPAGGWYQQFMPDLGGRTIKDITFVDSLTGFAITSFANDTSFILKTTNRGDNWFYSHSDTGIANYYRIQFINQSTGFVGGYIYQNSTFHIVKTTNAGTNWSYINAPFDIIAFDISALNENTIWIVDAGSLTGGVYRTTNGGGSWDRQLYLPGNNPVKIYMYNALVGFCCTNLLYRTTNGGMNWTQVTGADGFTDMYFQDNLTGWKANGFMRKTTDGGLTWFQQIMPSGGSIIGTAVQKLTAFGRDSLWGAYGGEIILPGNRDRDILFRTTNGGQNWLFQVPDTSMPYSNLSSIKFVNKLNGWTYAFVLRGLHTETGGGDTFYTAVNQININVPDNFTLFQNYPNPFNPVTNINYKLSRGIGASEGTSYVKLTVYDIQGKEIVSLVNKKQNAGTYKVTFDGSNYSSGLYFYSLFIDGILIDTKKMILLK